MKLALLYDKLRVIFTLGYENFEIQMKLIDSRCLKGVVIKGFI